MEHNMNTDNTEKTMGQIRNMISCMVQYKHEHIIQQNIEQDIEKTYSQEGMKQNKTILMG